MIQKKTFEESMCIVLSECRLAMRKIQPDEVIRLIEAVLAAEKVFFIGVGRVMLSLQAMAKRFAHLGIQAYVVGQITEPTITNKDLLIVGSGSGESMIPAVVAKKAKLEGARVAHIGSNPESKMKDVTDIFVRIPVRTKLELEDEISSRQPMTSLFEQSLFLLGDIMAMMIIKEKHLSTENLWAYHANLE